VSAASSFLAFAGLVITLLMVWRQSRAARVRLLAAQSVLLAVQAVVLGAATGRHGLYLVATALVVVKAWWIPRALGRMGRGEPPRPLAPARSAGIRLLTAGALVVAAYAIMLPVTATSTLPTRGGIPLAFAMALIGLYACATGRDAVAQILGFLMFENGIFALGLLATYGLPGLVEAGVFLDVLVVVLVAEGLVMQIRREHATLDLDALRELRDWCGSRRSFSSRSRARRC
jgi:hydrogenase-4 component E